MAIHYLNPPLANPSNPSSINFFSKITLPAPLGVTHLDLILSNTELITQVDIRGDLFSSDHDAITFKLCFPTNKTKKQDFHIHKYNNNNKFQLNMYLSSISTQLLQNFPSIDDRYIHFTTNLIGALNQIIPKTRITKKLRSPKYPTALLASIKEKARLYKLLKKEPFCDDIAYVRCLI